jgi:toluene monooxygenase electron transfer component
MPEGAVAAPPVEAQPRAAASIALDPAPPGFTITTAPAGVPFVCRPGETLLRAGLMAGLAMPYECASGSCGTCRVRLLEGKVESLWPAAPGLSERDRAKGDRILCCQSLARSACRIQVQPGVPSTRMPVPRRGRAVVEARRSLTGNVQQLILRVQRGGEGTNEFLAGQFMLFELGAGIGRRAYSMANVADDSGQLEFVIKAKPGGRASPVLFALEAGQTLEIEGPYGQAYLRPDSVRPLVAIAGGSGLGPMWSVVRAALAQGPARPVHLFFGVNEGADLFFADEFAGLEEHYTSLRVQRVVLRANPAYPADCRIGTVSDVALRELGDLNGCDVYMAGPPAMIDAALKDTVLAGRAAADRVFFDRFS